MSKKKIKLLSISDCNDKTGIVTFIKIFRNLGLSGMLPGFQLEIECYRNLPKTISQLVSPSVNTVKKSLQGPSMKNRIKEWLLNSMIGSFALFLGIFCKRGLYVCVKAKLRGRSDIYFYHDFITAIFGQVFFSAEAKHILVLHSGADPLKQLFIVFRGMRGTAIEATIRKYFGRVLLKQDLVVTLSEALATELRDQYSVTRIRCIYNTAEPLQFVEAERRSINGPLRLVAVGSLQYVKGFDLLIEAIALLELRHRSQVELKIIGEGDERNNLEELVLKHGLSQNVILIGNSGDVPRFLSDADLYILSSRDEGMPMAVLEAMQIGLPLISTRVGTLPEILDQNACIFVEKSAEDIARVLKQVLAGDHDLAAMRCCSHRTFQEKLSQELFIERYLSAFDDALGEEKVLWR